MGFDAAFVGKYRSIAVLFLHVPETDAKHSPFLIVFRQEAGLVFNRDVGKGAMKDRVGFDATSVWHIAFTFSRASGPPRLTKNARLFL